MARSYKRVLLKLSGEALSGDTHSGLDFSVINSIAASIHKATSSGVQIGIVVGGGNFWRGRSSGDMDRVTADQIGMLATVMNVLAVSDALRSCGSDTAVFSAVSMPAICEPFTERAATAAMNDGKIALFGGGTGSPFFSTDTAAALRAAQTGCDVLMKATMVDGVYDSDPKKNPSAKRYESISLSEVLEKKLGVIDAAAAALCFENNIPLLVFDMTNTENILKACAGEAIGTIVT
jgi:uridylate kinase